MPVPEASGPLVRVCEMSYQQHPNAVKKLDIVYRSGRE
jgi:hypothetical protein